MRLKQLLHVLVLVTGLHSIGCTVDNPSEDNATSTATSDLAGGVPTGVRCSDKYWLVDFYSDATHTTLVGQMSCSCYQPELLAGVTSSFSVLEFEDVCDFR
ncbi:MAG: hypothetical protein ABIY55_19225 [Kofleriaceae bacterium]